MEKYLYHLTNSKFIDRIKLEGLVPKTGCNSKIIVESIDAIYLTPDLSLPYWRILLDNPNKKLDTLIRIDSSKLDADFLIKEYNYDLYKEYLYSQVIPAEYLEFIPMNDDEQVEIMRSLCIYYLYSISNTTSKVVLCNLDESEAIRDLNIVNHVLNNLDYKSVSDQDIIDELHELKCAGDDTFIDKHYNSPLRLYQMLPEIKGSDEVRAKAKELNKLIVTKFSLDVLTYNIS